MGGLTVLKAIALTFAGRKPALSWRYRAPAIRHQRGRDTIGALHTAGRRQACGKLASRCLWLVACNTATQARLCPYCKRNLRQFPCLALSARGARSLSGQQNGHIAVIATRPLFRGGAYQHAIDAINPGAKVTARACTLLVSLCRGRLDRRPDCQGSSCPLSGRYFSTTRMRRIPCSWVVRIFPFSQFPA